MKNIDTLQVVDPSVQQPFLATSLKFLQDGNIEALSNLIIGLIGSSYSASQVYILFGCVRSGAADGAGSGSAAVTAGAVFFNGEVYTVDAFSTANINSQNLYSALSVTNPSPDPVTFSDGSSKNVHNVRKWLIAQAGSGSNLVNNWLPYGITINIQTSTSTGDAITTDVVSGGPIAYNSLVTKYSYFILNKICYLNFKLTFTITTGVVCRVIRLPIPVGITINKAGGELFSFRGMANFIAPSGTTNWCPLYVNSIDDGTEGNRICLRRATEGTDQITASTVATTILGSINFPVN